MHQDIIGLRKFIGEIDQMEDSPMVRGRGRSRKVIGQPSKRNLEVIVLSLNLLHDSKYVGIHAAMILNCGCDP
jgi:hypothetical protein